MDLQLQDRKALVTGASAGIGRGIAVVLAREGVHLVIAGRRREALEALRDEIKAFGGHAPLIVTGDLIHPDGPVEVAEAARRALPGIDILVNNAGASLQKPSQNAEDLWVEAHALGFTAPRRIAETLLPDICATGRGRIVNVTGGLQNKNVQPGRPSKIALEVWARGLSCDLAAKGVTVNCISPGRINSRQIAERLHPTEASRQRYIADNIPMGRFGDAEDIGNLTAFLVSPLASYITGVSIPVDGGMHRINRL